MGYNSSDFHIFGNINNRSLPRMKRKKVNKLFCFKLATIIFSVSRKWLFCDLKLTKHFPNSTFSQKFHSTQTCCCLHRCSHQINQIKSCEITEQQYNDEQSYKDKIFICVRFHSERESSAEIQKFPKMSTRDNERIMRNQYPWDVWQPSATLKLCMLWSFRTTR